MSLEEKSADVSAVNDEGEEGSAIAAGIRRDVKPWLNLVDDLSNLTRDAEISVPQVRFDSLDAAEEPACICAIGMYFVPSLALRETCRSVIAGRCVEDTKNKKRRGVGPMDAY